MGNRKINCILRFMEKSDSIYSELMTFLVEERLMKIEEQVDIDRPAERAKFIVNKLDKLLKEEKIMLVDWEWNILPVERIRLLIVTDSMQKDFTYGH